MRNTWSVQRLIQAKYSWEAFPKQSLVFHTLQNAFLQAAEATKDEKHHNLQ